MGTLFVYWLALLREYDRATMRGAWLREGIVVGDVVCRPDNIDLLGLKHLFPKQKHRPSEQKNRDLLVKACVWEQISEQSKH